MLRVLCLRQALSSKPSLCRGYADFVPLGASVQPKRVEEQSHLGKFRDGRELRFTYPSRSTPAPANHIRTSVKTRQDLRSRTGR